METSRVLSRCFVFAFFSASAFSNSSSCRCMTCRCLTFSSGLAFVLDGVFVIADGVVAAAERVEEAGLGRFAGMSFSSIDRCE